MHEKYVRVPKDSEAILESWYDKIKRGGVLQAMVIHKTW